MRLCPPALQPLPAKGQQNCSLEGIPERIILVLYAAIETSFDETGIAVLGADGRCLWSVLSSQVELHQPYGGCVPELAARTHLSDLPQLLAGMPPDILASIRHLGVTAGPGLPGCLLAGVNFARGLAKSLGTELYGLNHLAGHVFSPFMPAGASEPPELRFPHLALLVSGGHTELFMVRGLDDLELLGQTHDDAVGELLDKISAVLGYGYPGGAQMEQLARTSPNLSPAGEYRGPLRLPVPMRESGDLNFSYSGLKTAAVRLVRGMAEGGPVEAAELAASLFSAVLESLWLKLRSAAEQYSVELATVSGGVAINGFLRERFAAEAGRMGIECLFPARQHCLDNAEMMAWLLKCYVDAAIAPANFDARSSWNPGKQLTPVTA